MPTSLSLDTARRDDGKLVLIATGEIDLSNVDAFNNAISTVSSEGSGRGGKVTVDLSAVDYLDSAAINVLFARADHISLVAQPLLMSLLHISGLSELVTVEPAAPAPEG
ncbi:STAS domain-containing protein [Mycobacterium parmense]|uniref:Anti-anti-sigma factor n=1 Tax=Mycobacterium parmense TaxID=185642 RepID=A0A7I7YRG5_9MYCO|nr:STAS domain-containing protein [Mycobacterium parmense]MCV7348789.1 STAS domain-containing protein [Mycobacterium parmense]ORW49656.1 anti-anti-sigma factor [Mycobacterium parmense]BBZ44299.1 anti-anti-sigma factor [Mycobacterium parmense]